MILSACPYEGDEGVPPLLRPAKVITGAAHDAENIYYYYITRKLYERAQRASLARAAENRRRARRACIARVDDYLRHS